MYTVLLMCYMRWLMVMHCVAAHCRMSLLIAHLNSVSAHVTDDTFQKVFSGIGLHFGIATEFCGCSMMEAYSCS